MLLETWHTPPMLQNRPLLYEMRSCSQFLYHAYLEHLSRLRNALPHFVSERPLALLSILFVSSSLVSLLPYLSARSQPSYFSNPAHYPKFYRTKRFCSRLSQQPIRIFAQPNCQRLPYPNHWHDQCVLLCHSHRLCTSSGSYTGKILNTNKSYQRGVEGLRKG